MRSENLNRTGITGEQTPDILRELLEGYFAFRPELPVTNNSRYGDDMWDWQDPSNPRLRIYTTYNLTIGWLKLKAEFDLSDEIVADLKKFAFLRVHYSPQIFPTSKKNAKPSTITQEIRSIAAFVSHLRNKMSVDGQHLINNLSDIEVEDLKEALSTWSGNHEVPRCVLKFLGSPALGNILSCGAVKWNIQDVNTLKWNIVRGEPCERLPSELFRLLSDSATSDVKHFLQALEIKQADSTQISDGENVYLSTREDFKELFEEYRRARIALRQDPDGNGMNTYYRIKRAQSAHGMRLVADLVERARKAAMLIITMYTAGRLSEVTLLNPGCLRREGEQWVILGTLIKHEDLNKPVNQDKWVAIPIMRDAVRVLEEICPLTGSEYLFHGVRKHPNHKAMTSQNLAARLTSYLRLIDTRQRWKKWSLHPQQFRSSLVFELRKAGLGLPFITFQLKHAYYAMNYRINNVTLGYGGIGQEACLKEIHSANYEALRDVYHPDSPVAGGGADEHRKRRAAYFQGTALHGVNPDEVLQQLAKIGGIPMTDVGPALCLGQRKVVIDGVKTDPPCIGSLRCNPVRCPNGIIPDYKVPLWERIAAENRKRAEEPEFSHARNYLVEAAEEAEKVLEFFRDKHKGKINAG